MDGMFTEVGVGGIFALLVLREVFNFVNKRKNHGNTQKIELAYRQISDLWQWHNMSDAEGVKIWYVRRSLEDAVVGLQESISEQTKVMQALVGEIKDTRRDIKDLKRNN